MPEASNRGGKSVFNHRGRNYFMLAGQLNRVGETCDAGYHAGVAARDLRGLARKTPDAKVTRMPGTDDTDAALMIRVQAGDREAFEELVARFRQPVMNFVCRTLPDATEAEDLAQAVFIQVYKSAQRYRPTAKFSTWIFTIARNLCLNEIRRRSRHPAQPMSTFQCDDDLPGILDRTEDRQMTPPDAALHHELMAKTEEVLRELPENQRTAILLCREGDVSYEEIAEVLGCSLSAVKSLIFRARETLKTRLKPYLKSGSWVTDEKTQL